MDYWESCSIATGYGDKVPTLDCIFPLIQTIINWLLTFGGAVAVILIIFSGIRLITSGGDPKRVDAGKKTFTYAIAGLLIILFSFLIIKIIADATGVDCIKLMGFEAC